MTQNNDRESNIVEKHNGSNSIYFFKAIACFLIITIHAPIPKIGGVFCIWHDVRFLFL